MNDKVESRDGVTNKETDSFNLSNLAHEAYTAAADKLGAAKDWVVEHPKTSIAIAAAAVGGAVIARGLLADAGAVEAKGLLTTGALDSGLGLAEKGALDAGIGAAAKGSLGSALGLAEKGALDSGLGATATKAATGSLWKKAGLVAGVGLAGVAVAGCEASVGPAPPPVVIDGPPPPNPCDVYPSSYTLIDYTNSSPDYPYVTSPGEYVEVSNGGYVDADPNSTTWVDDGGTAYNDGGIICTGEGGTVIQSLKLKSTLKPESK